MTSQQSYPEQRFQRVVDRKVYSDSHRPRIAGDLNRGYNQLGEMLCSPCQVSFILAQPEHCVQTIGGLFRTCSLASSSPALAGSSLAAHRIAVATETKNSLPRSLLCPIGRLTC